VLEIVNPLRFAQTSLKCRCSQCGGCHEESKQEEKAKEKIVRNQQILGSPRAGWSTWKMANEEYREMSTLCQYLTPILIIHAIFSPTIIPWRFQHDMQRAWVFKTGLGESQP
jgi:hypothetical protein